MSREIDRSLRFYEALGFTTVRRYPDDAPRYACIRRDAVELHLQWHDAGEWARIGDRPVYRFIVDDVDALYRDFRARPLVVDIKEVHQTPWGTREFHLLDPDLNGLQFYRPLE